MTYVTGGKAGKGVVKRRFLSFLNPHQGGIESGSHGQSLEGLTGAI